MRLKRMYKWNRFRIKLKQYRLTSHSPSSRLQLSSGCCDERSRVFCTRPQVTGHEITQNSGRRVPIRVPKLFTSNLVKREFLLNVCMLISHFSSDSQQLVRSGTSLSKSGIGPWTGSWERSSRKCDYTSGSHSISQSMGKSDQVKVFDFH